MRHTIYVLLILLGLCIKAGAQSHLADFTISKDSVCTADSILATYTGTGSGTAKLFWTFKNGTPDTSSKRTVWVHFKNSGPQDSAILIVTDMGVADTQKKNIFVKQTPLSHFVFGSANGCQFNFISVTANGTAGGNAIYNWSFPGSIKDSGIGSGPIYAKYDTGWHAVTLIINDNGCLSAPYKDSIYVDSLPVPAFTALYLRGCTPLGDSFTNKSKNAITFQWKFGDSTISANVNPFHIYTQYGFKNVELVATSKHGCIDSITLANYINVVAKPVSNFNTDPLDNVSIQIKNACVTFFDQSTFANHYKWNFGDTLSSKIDSTIKDSSTATPKTTHCYKLVGQYYACLYSYNYLGCVDSACHLLTIVPDNEIFIPNTFTPNGDARDDKWLIYGNDIDRIDMKIYDRWGELVYYAADFFAGWDGTFNNKPASTGVYSYITTIYRTNNRIEHYKGGVTLIR